MIEEIREKRSRMNLHPKAEMIDVLQKKIEEIRSKDNPGDDESFYMAMAQMVVHSMRIYNNDTILPVIRKWSTMSSDPKLSESRRAVVTHFGAMLMATDFSTP